MSASFDIDAIRAETPACEDVVHFNNAGAALPPKPVLDATIEFLNYEARVGGYESVLDRADQLDNVYRAGAAMFSCEPSELALTSNASEAWWRAFTSVPLTAGDRVLTGNAEYVSNAFGLIQAQQRGVEVTVIPDDEHGQVDLEQLAAELDERVKLVSLTHIPTSGGLVNPAAKVGAMTRENGSLFLLDACQSAGQMPLNVDELQCDFMSLTGRKFLRGPRGTGLLYVRSAVMADLEQPQFIDGYSADWTATDGYELQPTAKRFELFETSFAGKAGLGVALEYANAIGLDIIQERVVGLAARLREQLSSIDGVAVHDQGINKCGIVTFSIAGVDAIEFRDEVRTQGINVSQTVPSVWQVSQGAPDQSIVRSSVHYYNTHDEIARFCEHVAAAA